MHGDSEGTGGEGMLILRYSSGHLKAQVVHTGGKCAWRLFLLRKELRYSPSFSQRHCNDWTQLWWEYHLDGIATCRYSHCISSFLHQNQGKILKFRFLGVSWWHMHNYKYSAHTHLKGFFVQETQMCTYAGNISCTTWMQAKLCLLLQRAHLKANTEFHYYFLENILMY